MFLCSGSVNHYLIPTVATVLLTLYNRYTIEAKQELLTHLDS